MASEKYEDCFVKRARGISGSSIGLVEEFLAYMKINVKQRMLNHMLETSELMNGNSSIMRMRRTRRTT